MRRSEITKLVSIILPTYNRAYVLNRAIDSVMSQTFKDWELIIIDDNSKDNTEDLIKGINDKRIKYIKNIKNLGGAESR
ncbi:MAG: glycosyltransferase family 2 protein, partial [Romboutsia sp.]|nr:glycosyltransferase family 2 protein [Romboutsia sp.]